MERKETHIPEKRHIFLLAVTTISVNGTVLIEFVRLINLTMKNSFTKLDLKNPSSYLFRDVLIGSFNQMRVLKYEPFGNFSLLKKNVVVLQRASVIFTMFEEITIEEYLQLAPAQRKSVKKDKWLELLETQLTRQNVVGVGVNELKIMI